VRRSRCTVVSWPARRGPTLGRYCLIRRVTNIAHLPLANPTTLVGVPAKEMHCRVAGCIDRLAMNDMILVNGFEFYGRRAGRCDRLKEAWTWFYRGGALALKRSCGHVGCAWGDGQRLFSLLRQMHVFIHFMRARNSLATATHGYQFHFAGTFDRWCPQVLRHIPVPTSSLSIISRNATHQHPHPACIPASNNHVAHL
jgi:hypothetical protein